MKAGIYKITYKNTKNIGHLRILGEEYVKKNKNKAKIIINNKKYILNNIVSFDNIGQNKIKLILYQNIYNLSFMFKNCNLLESFSKLSFDNYIDDYENNSNINIEYEKQTSEDGENDLFTNSNSNNSNNSLYFGCEDDDTLPSQISNICEKT